MKRLFKEVCKQKITHTHKCYQKHNIGENNLHNCTNVMLLITFVYRQFAEKLHFYTLPRSQVNTRTKDIIDLVLLLKYNNRSFESFYNTLKRVFKARNTHPLPEILPEPPKSWDKPFAELALECGIAPSLETGFKQLCDFYHEIQAISKSTAVV